MVISWFITMEKRGHIDRQTDRQTKNKRGPVSEGDGAILVVQFTIVFVACWCDFWTCVTVLFCFFLPLV